MSSTYGITLVDFCSLEIPLGNLFSVNVQSYSIFILLNGILSPSQLIIPALGMLAIDLTFLLQSFKLSWSDELSLNKKSTSHLFKGKLPQLWGEST